jgi:hypothetical protein
MSGATGWRLHWNIFDLGHLHCLASSPLELAHVSLFPDLFAQLSLCGAHRDRLAC